MTRAVPAAGLAKRPELNKAKSIKQQRKQVVAERIESLRKFDGTGSIGLRINGLIRSDENDPIDLRAKIRACLEAEFLTYVQRETWKAT
jgi:hypothetical protein